MRIGFSIFLLAVGAILAFAVNYTVAGVNIHVVGWILMAAGVVGLFVTLLVLMPRDRKVVTSSADGRVQTTTDTTTPPSSIA
jgi:hypothetical protein